jgi:hypothetical protein
VRVRLSAASRLRHQQAAEKSLPGRRFRNTIHLENGSFRGVSMRGKDETLGSLFSYVDLAERIRSRFMPTMAADKAPKTVGSAGLVVFDRRHAASQASRRQKLIGKSPAAALRSPEASQMGNAGWLDRRPGRQHSHRRRPG